MSVVSIDLRMHKSSGIGTYIVNVVPRVIEMCPDITFYLLGDLNQLLIYPWTQRDNVKIIDFQSPIYSVQEQIQLCRIIPKSNKLLWSPHYNIPLFYRGKLMVTIHDVFHIAMPQFVYKWYQRLYAKVMFTAVCRKANRIITVSDFTANELRRLTGDNKLLPLTSVHNGVDHSWYCTKEELSPHSIRYIVCVGNVKPHKNIPIVLKAFKKIADQIPHDLLIIGKKEDFITGDARVADAVTELQDRVHLLGVVPDDVLKSYVTHADVLVFPSLYEGFGLPPLEAMACGCPVLASSAASIPEVCGDAVLYFDPQDAEQLASRLLELLQNNELRADLSAKGKLRSVLFDWRKCSTATATIIREALSE